jgi:UDP-glucose 4-epimerase
MKQISEMNYFVTGGAGFIGSHLADSLTGMGEVTVYDNLSSGRREYLGQNLDKGGFRFVQADLLDREQLAEAMKGSEVVFHMAANPEVKDAAGNTELDLKQGTIATYNVLEAMRLNDVREIVFASSSTVYGDTSGKPVAEDYGPLQPISLYGASKLASEGLITAFCHLFGMQAWIFRFANVVGDRATHGVISDFISKLRRNPALLQVLGDGLQEKPYIHVRDCVKGMLFGFQHAHQEVNVYNLGNDDAVSVTEIAHMVVEVMELSGVTLNYTGGKRGWPGDVPRVRLDTSRMEALNWRPEHNSREAVRKAIREILGETD